LTFAICQAVSKLYEEWIVSLQNNTGIVAQYAGQFALLLFTVITGVLRSLMGVLTDKLDLEMKNKKFRIIRVLFLYVMDMFYFFFYRSLFMNVSSYQVFVPIAFLSCLFQFINWPVKSSYRFFKILNLVVDTITRSKESSTTEENYEIYKDEVAMDFFFYVVAEFVSLVTFTACFAFLFYAWNSNAYEFPPVIMEFNTTYNRPNAVIFISYLPITLFFEVIYVIFVRRYFRKLTGRDAFQLGSVYLQNNRVYFAFILVTLHVSQDVFIARNKFNFCLTGGFLY